MFDPFDLSRIEVRYRRRPFGVATMLLVDRHGDRQRESQLPPPAAPTGMS